VDVAEFIARNGNRHNLDVTGEGNVSPACLAPERFPPVQVQHGDADEIVPHELSRKFVDRLKAAGRDAELITLADTPHGYGYNLAEKKAQEGWRHATEYFRARLLA
jgi:dipeptidyl aminopeptidase/acylaminoacyl peptidase